MSKNTKIQSEIDNIFEQYNVLPSPGCAVAVVREGEVLYEKGYGLANLEVNAPLTPKSVFNIGSMAKQFTAFAIVLLAADGKLTFEDDLRLYLPDMHDFGEKITIRHLLHHTSGLRDSFPALLSLAEWRDTDATTSDDVYGLLKAQRGLNFEPGAEFEYANSNYVLLSQICARVSGQTFAEFCQERIFTPLAMRDTHINASYYQLIPGRALGYYDNGDAGWLNAPLTDAVVGPTNVYSTVGDLAKWDENFYTGAVGGKANCALMHQPGSLNDGTVLDYAFGLEVGPAHQYRGWPMVEHGGSQGGYSSWMLRLPEQHLSVIVLRNHFSWDTRDSALKVADVFLTDRPCETAASESAPLVDVTEPVVLTVSQLEPYAGMYFNAERVALRRIALHEERLQFEELDLLPVNATRFYFEVEPQTQVVFTPAERGRAGEMKTVTSSGEYAYTRVDPVTLNADALAAYAGRYYSPELDITWTISAGEGQLIAQRRKYVDSRLTPLFKDTFRDDWSPLLGYPRAYLVRFERDAHAAIVGLRVSGDGVRKMVFDRI